MNKQEFVEAYHASTIYSNFGNTPRDVDDLRDRACRYGSHMFSPNTLRFYKTRFHQNLYGAKNNVVIWSDKKCFDDYTRVYNVAIYSEKMENSGEPYFQNSYGAELHRYEEKFSSLAKAKAFLKECGIVE